MGIRAEIREVVLLRGSSILHAETLQEIAVLVSDGQWRTPEGAVVDAIGVPDQSPQPVVKPDALLAAHREQDEAWLAQALSIVRELACEQKELTVDDCWERVEMPPRKPSMMSNLMVAAQRQSMIQKTSKHRRSTRPINGGRTVRVWRSLLHQDSSPDS
jgi:hypothetical protein